MAYQIPASCLDLFYEAGQLVIPIIDPSDHTYGLENAGKRPIKGLSFKDAAAETRYPYEQFHNAAWVVRHNVVIDIDPRNGGVEGYDKLCKLVGGAPLHSMGCPTVTTGGGGKHIYFSLPEGYRGVGPQKILTKHGIEGIEVKSGNGYVVIPGSVHYSGKPYEWDTKRTIADGLPPPPQELLDLIVKPDIDYDALTGGLSVASSSSHDMDRARVLVAEYESAGSGERNEQMYRLAVRLLDFGLDSASAHEHLAAANIKNHPPLGQSEIHDIYKKAFRYRKNDFGAMSLEADFDVVDTSVDVGGERLSGTEAMSQLTDLTGYDECIAKVEELIAAHKDDDHKLVAHLAGPVLDVIANSTEAAQRAAQSMLCGRGGVFSKDELKREIADRARTGDNDDLSERFAAYILEKVYDGQRLRFSNKTFFAFNPNKWHHVADQEVQKKVLDEVAAIRQENPDFKVSSHGIMQTTTNIIKARANIRPENFFPHTDRVPQRLLNCGNGEVWVGNDGGIELREPDPAHRQFTSLNVNWNPDADCPVYKKTLLEVFQLCDNPEEVARHHIEMKGYMLSPFKPLPVIEMCIGSGANGKSMLNAGLMVAIGGNDAVGLGPLSMFKMDNAHTTARLMNRMVWVEPDLDGTKAIPAGLLKAFSENTMVTVEPKFMDAINVMSTCSWTLLSNEPPHSNDSSRGLARRIYAFPDDFDFEQAGQADHGLLNRLIEEKEGIFRLWVEGLARFASRGDQFVVPDECIELRDSWMQSQNILGSFISECCVQERGAETYVRELYQNFIQFITRDGAPRDQVMQQRVFTNKLSSVGGLKVVAGTGNQRKVIGLRLDAWAAVVEGGGDRAALDVTKHDWLE